MSTSADSHQRPLYANHSPPSRLPATHYRNTHKNRTSTR